MRIRQQSSLAKTLSFAVIHLGIAATMGWLLTGAFILGSLLAFVEPTLNTVVAHHLERIVPGHRRLFRSALLGVSHLVVAIGVGFALTGSWVAASVYAVLEPAANAVAHYFFERWWEGGSNRSTGQPRSAATAASFASGSTATA